MMAYLRAFNLDEAGYHVPVALLPALDEAAFCARIHPRMASLTLADTTSRTFDGT